MSNDKPPVWFTALLVVSLLAFGVPLFCWIVSEVVGFWLRVFGAGDV